MSIHAILQKKPYIFWYVSNPNQLSEEAVVEQVLSYGNWEDVQELIKIDGIKKIASLFTKTQQKKRSNYSKPIAHYFELYFQRHAH